jgi:hypothetical protein
MPEAEGQGKPPYMRVKVVTLPSVVVEAILVNWLSWKPKISRVFVEMSEL